MRVCLQTGSLLKRFRFPNIVREIQLEILDAYERDFLIEGEHAIYPLEVKAGASQKKKSLLIYSQKYAPSKLLIKKRSSLLLVILIFVENASNQKSCVLFLNWEEGR